jgi:hypothetical protein
LRRENIIFGANAMSLEDKLEVLSEKVYLRCGTVAIDTDHTEGPYIAILVDQENGREPALILATGVNFKFFKGDYRLGLSGVLTEEIPEDVRRRIYPEPYSEPGSSGAGDGDAAAGSA